MLVKGRPVRVGDLARTFAACHPVLVHGVSTSPVLLRGYLASLEHCIGANDCAYCRRELDRLVADLGTTCAECGAARFRRRCADNGPCDGGRRTDALIR